MSGATSIQRVQDAATAHGLKIRQGHAGDYMMQCPLHTPDNNPSVHVTYRDGRTLICDMHDPADTEQLVAAIGLTLSDLYDNPIEPGAARPLRAVGHATGIVETVHGHMRDAGDYRAVLRYCRGRMPRMWS